MNALELKNVGKNYGDFSLKDISIELPCGCIMGLVGENGAGKSTTIKLILDMAKRDSGEVLLWGQSNRIRLNELKEDIGVVLDEAYYPEQLNIKELNLFLKNTYRDWDREEFFRLVRRFSLPEQKKFKDFSRGMKMKTAIAAALSHKARLLILDEATSGLDPVVRDEILDIFSEFTRDEQNSVLISSHIISDLEKICDYIAYISDGRLLFCEEKDRLLEEYAILRCPADEIKDYEKSAVVSVKTSRYGAEALVRRDRMPKGARTEPADIEQIVLFMAKEAREKK